MEDTNTMSLFATFVTLVLAFATVGAGIVFAHCDTVDGPIIKSAAAGVKPPAGKDA